MANGKAGTTSEKASRATPPKPARPAAEAPAPAPARRFEALSGIPGKALYTEGDLPPAPEAPFARPGRFRIRAGSPPGMTARPPGPLPRFRASGPPEQPNRAFP